MATEQLISPSERERDKQALRDKAVRCFRDDRRIVTYFSRGHVKIEEVANQLVDGSAFKQAVQLNQYRQFASTRAELRDIIGHNNDIIDDGILNARTAAVLIGSIIIVALLLLQAAYSGAVTWLITFTSAIFAASAGALFAIAQSHSEHRHRRLAFSVLTMSISLCLMISLHILINLPWTPFIFFPELVAACTVCYFIVNEETIRQCRCILAVVWKDRLLFHRRRQSAQLQQKWLDDCVEDIIMPQTVLIINTILGKDKDRLLVEQDSEGLRKLQDPNFTVYTRSERRVASVLSQMDGGSIALAGPRGAGKSTLLRNFSGPVNTEINGGPCISVYVTAPAEYVPRDFIAELLQRLCEAYLVHEDYRMPEPIYNERKHSLRRALGRIPGIVKLALRTAVVAAIIAWMAWPLIRSVARSHYHYHYHYYFTTVLDSIKHWFYSVYTRVSSYLHKKSKSAWGPLTVIARVIVIIVALFFLPPLWRWRAYIGPRREPALAKTARDYLLRLQVEKTVTWGRSLNLNPTTGRLLGATVSRGGTTSYTPWTLPELVGYTRRFMRDISNTFRSSTHAVIVGIDEIDRIGSLDHAERFIGEIKAIFGIEKCYFLVAVAEDVGSIFAQRATAGRSILENAFDDIIVVEPLNFSETRDLLLKRVPGFTDSFVYLVHALSGGLPRELIRVTRRLVEVNQELRHSDRHPRLEDLAFALVKAALLEAIRATRSQLARLTLGPNWTVAFEKLRSASTTLGYTSGFFMREPYEVIKELSELRVPEIPKEKDIRPSAVATDEDNARRIIEDFAAFSYFGMTVIDAFSDEHFDLQVVQSATAGGSEGSYEELAVARTELTISPENSRTMLRRFRDFLHLNETQAGK